MKLSQRVLDVPDSITLKLNAKAQAMIEAGKKVFNLTAGQLPCKPPSEFVHSLSHELTSVKSFQYTPVSGLPKLREKIISDFEKSREILLDGSGTVFDVVISNGGKHSLFNILGALVDPGDEVLLFAPYWLSYPEMVKIWGGKSVVVAGNPADRYAPSLKDVRASITSRTKAVIINSPNNPTGVHYSANWMKEFASLMKEYPKVWIISDEIYFKIAWGGETPTAFYQFEPSLLNRTVIIDGISKSLASTGLRLGYAIAPNEISVAVSKLQAQTTSGANALVQAALVHYDWSTMSGFLKNVNNLIRINSAILEETLNQNGPNPVWYRPLSAFYFVVDFTKTKVFDIYSKKYPSEKDLAPRLCEDLLEQEGLALVPLADFGLLNAGRLSLVLEEGPFKEASCRLSKFLG